MVRILSAMDYWIFPKIPYDKIRKEYIYVAGGKEGGNWISSRKYHKQLAVTSEEIRWQRSWFCKLPDRDFLVSFDREYLVACNSPDDFPAISVWENIQNEVGSFQGILKVNRVT